MAKATKKQTAEKDVNNAPKPKAKDSKKKEKDTTSPVESAQTFLKESWAEFRKIQWPTPRQAMNESIIVLLTVFFVVAMVTVYDWAAGWLVSLILQK